jgi:hypothetical protein
VPPTIDPLFKLANQLGAHPGKARVKINTAIGSQVGNARTNRQIVRYRTA